jgi:hypothetical protein
MFLIGVCCGAIPILILMMVVIARHRRQFRALIRDAVTTDSRIAMLVMATEAEKVLTEKEKSDLWGLIHTQNEQLAEARRAIEAQGIVIRQQEGLIREHIIRVPEPRPSLH